MKNLSLITCIFFVLSCQNRNPNTDSETVQIKNKSITTSENLTKFKSLLDVNNLEPNKVKFQYVFIDNSQGLLPGPSDSYISAILYYDSLTIDSLNKKVEKKEYDKQITDSQRFFIKWFDEKTLNQTKFHQDSLKVYYDFLFNTKGKLILFENMILYRD
ncbi:hypothetical protein [Moheibacter sediminis]|uniref:Lipoprotein n=1 Tax=Moheibacter sediminis TaxID=1434700 RepID=A0A1W1Z6K8_9FLAO|nr:hypothetical protein [Moheibacter sediminis]SMC43942.1 hypothetical protein SAMN06296427_102235 [Moheibacter sediminis]